MVSSLFLSFHHHLFPKNYLNKIFNSRVWLRKKEPMQHLVGHQDWELLLLPLHRGILASDTQWFVWWHNHWLLARHYVSEDTIVKNHSTRNLHCMHSKVEIICFPCQEEFCAGNWLIDSSHTLTLCSMTLMELAG